ncbi:MAG: GntR family transcriptional regulator [Planctomycetes bacterium]|nr:GntR family transcriptional regulator [Planctomycetota bacterium]
MFELQVTPGGNRPIYRQIIDQVRQAVATSELAVGDGLPSVRQLAEELVLNHNTVAKAYAELVREGVLESQHGRGVFVAKRRRVFSASERKRRLDQAMNVFLSEVLTLDYTPQQIEEAVAKRLDQMTGSKAEESEGD